MTDLRPDIEAALSHAYAKHGCKPWGRHEFYGILMEEIDEMWDVIKADGSTEELRAEAVQCAAVILRYFETGDRYLGS